MVKTRLTYFCCILFIIVLGIASRAFGSIPLFVGDVLYAVMMYCIVGFLLPNKKYSYIFSIALLLCFAIEFQQTLQYEWLVTLRLTLPGKYILGQGFLWSDLIYYSLGTGLGYVADVFLLRNYKL
ncbi:DUF2809 domain-containing protein [Flavobacterium sp. GCM10023249]|uniref:ribosomal maturation YjgA family protein n=1 Tax=unclassified Flavobacterium TaxID=196869 RepID=UPI003618BD8B